MTLGEWQRLIARIEKALTVPTTDGSALRTTRTILREGLDGSAGAKAFFRDCISEALNRAADDVSAVAPETEQVHDATNLVVCAGLHYLENPGATLHQAIEANYEEDVSLFNFISDVFLQHVKDALEEDEELGLEAQAEHEKIVEVAQRVCRRHNIPYALYLADLRERSGSRYGGLEIDADADDSDGLEYFRLPIPEISPAERRAELLADAQLHAESEHRAREWLRDDREACAIFGEDAHYEWDLRDYDIHFLFTCYCIDLTVRLYREHEAQKTETTEQSAPTAEQISAVVELAERGIARELGATDARHHYTEEETAMMKTRFDNARAGIAAITTLSTRSTETVQS
ncbi:hypothetical protein ACFRQM_32975 [Streptomyces sp. NPDC056831]|uniref:hypothetical protein n=1 Tax=Streptomyces sp. NPDC056831 TaxID=3345954 RepID=UPI0036B8EC72